MRKIHNMNGSGRAKLIGYAGLMGNGRGSSRKCRSSFTRSSPAASCAMLIGFTSLIAFGLAALIGCDDTEQTNAHKHSWGNWTVVTQPGCETEGLEERVCGGDASHIQTEVIPASGHAWTTSDWVDGIVPNCTTGGTPNQVCQNNSTHIKTGAYVNPLGHNYQWVNQGNGTEKEICGRDGGHTGQTREIYQDYIKMLSDKTTLADIDFSIPKGASVGVVKMIVSNDLQPGLMAHAQHLHTEYGKMGGTFANTVRTKQSDLIRVIGNGSDGRYMKQVAALIPSWFPDAIGGLFTNQNDAELFKIQFKAWQTAHYLAARANQDDILTQKQSLFAQQIQKIVELGGVAIPDGDINSIVNILTGRVMNTIPESAGAPRFDLMQQAKTFVQFDAWIDNVATLHPGLDWTASVLPKLQQFNIIDNYDYLAQDAVVPSRRELGLHI